MEVIFGSKELLKGKKYPLLVRKAIDETASLAIIG